MKKSTTSTAVVPAVISAATNLNQRTLDGFLSHKNRTSMTVTKACSETLGGKYTRVLNLIQKEQHETHVVQTIFSARRQRLRKRFRMKWGKKLNSMMLPVIHPQPEVHW